MVVIAFLFMIFYITRDLYVNIMGIFIDNQTIKLIFSIIIFFLLSQIVMAPIFFKNINPSVTHIIYVSLCVLAYCFFLIILKDIISLFKKDFNFLIVLLVSIICLVILCVYGYFNNKIEITRYNLTTNKEIDIKLVFVSDLHIGNKGINEKQMEKIVSIINNENPDLLLFGGDVVENEEVFNKNKNYTNIIQKINTKNIYGILGNHEFYFNNNIENMIKLIENDYKINILQDNILKINNLIIVGRIDYSSKNFNIKRKGLKEILNSVENTDKNYLLVLDHNPTDFVDSINNNVDLQLSGHTHGGQFFPFNMINRLFYKKNNYGIQKKQKTNLIVSSGIGTSGIPLRIFTKKEIVVVNINNIRKERFF